MTRTASVFAVALAAAGFAHSAEPVEIKGFLMGGDLHAEAAKGGLSCRPHPTVIGMEGCSAFASATPESLKTFGGVPASLALLGFGNTLGSLFVTFPEASFRDLRDVLREKFPGLKCEDSTVQNRMGASFEQTRCTEQTPDGALVLFDRRGSDLTKGVFSYSTKAHRDLSEAASQQRSSAGKKDL